MLQTKEIWKLAGHTESFVRRALYQVFLKCPRDFKDVLDLTVLSSNFLITGLHTNQTGSSQGYMHVLLDLSNNDAGVWTKSYQGSGRKSASNRLLYFLRKGSQGNPPDFWPLLSQLFERLNHEGILAGSSDSIFRPEDGVTFSQILDAVREGINRRDELRSNSTAAWTAYVKIFRVLVPHEDQAQVRPLLQKCLMPLVSQYVTSSVATSDWTVFGPQQDLLCSEACLLASSLDATFFDEEWQKLSAKFTEDLQVSLPEQSKDYVKSQDSVVNEARKWYRLQNLLAKNPLSAPTAPSLQSSITKEVPAAVSILKTRIGKPFGAGAALEIAMRDIPDTVLSDSATANLLTNFVQHDLSRLVLSPSLPYLLELLGSLARFVNVEGILSDCLHEIRRSDDSMVKLRAMKALVSSTTVARTTILSLDEKSDLYNILDQAFVKDDEANWDIVISALTNPAASQEFTDRIVSSMVENLPVAEKSLAALHGLNKAAKAKRTLLTELFSQSNKSGLVTQILLLTESPDFEVAQAAKELSTLIDQTLTATGNQDVGKPMIDLIRNEIVAVGVHSLT